jgi:hypothetical protein
MRELFIVVMKPNRKKREAITINGNRNFELSFCIVLRFKSYWKNWILDTGYWILDTGYWILDTGYWILDTGYWILDTGSQIVLSSLRAFVSSPEQMDT